LNDRGIRLLGVLDEIASIHRVPVAAVSLAWLLAQKGVAAPIASARTVEQLAELLPVAHLSLSEAEVRSLTL
jgi:aryl-alcohol dehydrogenase-like predicted oxidoreductase